MPADTMRDSFESSLRPLSGSRSLSYFIFPGLLVGLGAHILTPALVNAGIAAFLSYAFGVGLPLAILFLAALIAYRLEQPRGGFSLRQRYRLKPIRPSDWGWLLLILIAKLLVALPFAGLAQALITAGIIPYPQAAQIAASANEALISERGWLIGIAIGLLVVNVLGEELWFRGYVLPRQEQAYGNRGWVIHWLLWWFVFHFFKWWDLITLLPVTGLSVYLAHRTHNTTVVMVEHWLSNLASIVLLLFVTG
ncbi:MAG: type II CAAX endopeptidase family protein [Aggregatilineales bacterium]